MHGILTSDSSLARAEVGDFTHYIVDDVAGRQGRPMDDVVNAIACWGDTEAVRDDRDELRSPPRGLVRHPIQRAITGERSVPLIPTTARTS